MSNNEVFMNIEMLGDLYMYDVLLAYIYPRVFVCEDMYNCKYLFYEMESREDIDTWLVSKITKKEYYDIVDKKKAIQSAYSNRMQYAEFVISKHYDKDDAVTLSYDVEQWVAKLPRKDVFAEKEIVDDAAIETLKIARETGNTTFDIRLFPGTDRHFVPKNILSELCASITPMLSSILGNKRGETVQVATAPGSCIVRFSFPEQVNMLKDYNIADEMRVLNSVISEETIGDKIKDKNKFYRSYTKFLDTIRKAGSDVQFTTASPNSNSVQKIELTKEAISERFARIKDAYETVIEEKTEKSVLIALDSKQNRFKVQFPDGSVKSGNLREGFLNERTYEVPKEYIATIKIEKKISDNDSGAKEKLTLIELK